MAEKTDYTANSKASKEGQSQKEPPKQLVSGTVKVKKKPFGQKFRETFVATDFKTVKEYLINDVILPSARDLFFDAINKGAGRMMYGDRGKLPSGTFGGPRTSYQTPVGRLFQGTGIQTIPFGQRTMQPAALPSASNEDFILPSREDAEVIIDGVNERLQMYGFVTVYDVKVMLGLSPLTTDMKWGWENLRGAKIEQTRQGWVMLLPTPIVLN